MIGRRHVARAALRLGLVVLGIGAATGLGRLAQVNSSTAGFAFVISVLLVATAWGLPHAVVASVVAMACLNFFFLPPIHTFTVADPQNWVALFSFLVTAIVASELSARAKRQAAAALERQRELERLYALGRAILLGAGDGPLAQRLARWVAESFGLGAVVLFDAATEREYRAGPQDLTIPPEVLKAALSGDIGERSDDSHARFAVVRLGGKPAGLLALRGLVSDTAVDAIASLVAIGLERARAQQSENRAEAARQSDELKSTLLDAIAHEFKTPLTSIKVAASAVLSDPALSPPQREMLSVVDEETDRLSNLVSDAIRMSRLEAGKVKLNLVSAPARELIEAAISQMRPRLEERPLRRAIAENLPALHVDRELIHMALRQLIDNALKYSPPGSAVELGAARENGSVALWVADSGPGVPPADQERVFERFFRSRHHRHGVPGSGIGLSVVRDIARAHGGDASVRSQPGQGARFAITLPLEAEA